MTPQEFKFQAPSGYKSIAQYFDNRARKAAENVSGTAEELASKIQKSFRKASAAAKANKLAHGFGPMALIVTALTTIATGGGGAIPILAVIGLWGATEVGSATYAIKSDADGNALEEKQKKPAAPAP